MNVPGVALQVFGADVRVVVNADFSRLAEPEQRQVLALCRETLDLALGGCDPHGWACWFPGQPAAGPALAGCCHE